MSDPSSEGRRPRDLALLLLSTAGDPPRERARDQRADVAGMELRRRILDRVAAIDPEPNDFAECLTEIALELGEPTGPARSVATAIWQDWEASRIAPEFWSWLVAEAVIATDRGHSPPRKRRGGDDVA